MATEVKARCGCGREHNAEGWDALEPVGRMAGYPAEDGLPALPAIELKNCACGSTIAAEVSDAA